MSALPVFLKYAPRQLKTDLNRFRRDEDGGLIVFSLMVLISMLVLGGMAVDFMRQENQRVVLQGVADRSVLSAASLQQTINGQELVEDYFLKSGVSSTLSEDPIYEDGGNSKRVSVVAQQELDTFFLRLIGIDTLSSTATANAIEATGKVEISLVIDVSASMRSGGTNGRIQNNEESIRTGGKIADLRTAAIGFSRAVLDPVYEGQISLNIIPYGGHVNPGPEMFEILNGTGKAGADDHFMIPFDAVIPGTDDPAMSFVRDPDVPTSVDQFFWVVNPEVAKGINQFYQVDKTDTDAIEDHYAEEVTPAGYEYTGPVELQYSEDGPVVIDGTTVTNEMITQIVTQIEDPDTGDLEYIPVIGLALQDPVLGYDINAVGNVDIAILPGPDGVPYVRYSAPASCMEIQGADDWSTSGPPEAGQAIIPNYMIYGFGKWEIQENVRRWGWCPQDETVIKYALQDAGEAESYIEGLSLYDGTGTDAAMKWGLATLDPEMQPLFELLNAELDDSGVPLVPDDFTNRPSAYDDSDTRKILVLMTDGGVTGQRRPNQPTNIRNLLDVTPNNQANVQNWMGWTAGTGANGGWTEEKTANQARADLVSLCVLARAEEREIAVYTIAFELTGTANTQAMRDCATPDAPPKQYYFETSGAGISDVFQEIAQQISELRLTE